MNDLSSELRHFVTRDILHHTSMVASKFRSASRSGRCFMETLTEVASSFAWKALTDTVQRQLCLSPKGSGGEAYGLRHITAVAAQPRLKACSLKTSQVHLALTLKLMLNTLKDLRNSSTLQEGWSSCELRIKVVSTSNSMSNRGKHGSVNSSGLLWINVCPC